MKKLKAEKTKHKILKDCSKVLCLYWQHGNFTDHAGEEKQKIGFGTPISLERKTKGTKNICKTLEEVVFWGYNL